MKMRNWITSIICLLAYCGLAAQPNTQIPANAKSLHERALELHEIDKNEEAFNLTIKALSMLDSINQDETALYAECLHDAGMFALMGNKDLCTFTYYIKRAISLKKELYGNNDDYYWSIQCYADGLLEYSDELSFPNNIEILEEAIEAYETTPYPQTIPSYYRALNNLAQMYEDIEITKSIEYGEKLVQLSRLNLVSCDSTKYISNLGYYYKEDEQYDKAFHYLGRAINSCESNGEKSNDLKISYERIASLYARIGEYGKACDYEEKALELEESLNGTETSAFATIIMNYGCYLYMNKNPQKGLSYLRMAYSHNRSDKSNVAFNLAGLFSGNNQPDSCFFYLKKSWDFTRQDVSRNLHNMSVKNRFHYLSNGRTYHCLRAPLHYLKMHPNHCDLINLAYECVLYHKSAMFGNLEITSKEDRSTKMNIDDVRNSLKENEVAIEVFYNPYVNLYGDDIIYVFLVKKEWEDPKCTFLNLESIYNALSGAIPATSDYLPLYETIWKDILSIAELKEDARIYISCDGVLSNIPIEWISDYDNEYIGDKYDIIRVSSTQMISQLKDEKSVESATLYGGLNYEGQNFQSSNQIKQKDPIWNDFKELLGDSTLTNYRSSLEYLPWSHFEVDTIHHILSHYLPPNRLFLLTDTLGTEQSFKSMSGNSPSLIHIATHGFFVNFEESMDWHDYYTYCMDNTGVLLSGGATSFANNSLTEDGLLRSTEIAQLDLSTTDLLVLSACKTGLNGISPYGLIGLQRAFKTAGVQTIIMTLQDVDDAASCSLMTNFYTNIMNGMSKRKAFYEAICSLRDDERFCNFNYWAWFIMID